VGRELAARATSRPLAPAAAMASLPKWGIMVPLDEGELAVDG
jgi:hypothetical protein